MLYTDPVADIQSSPDWRNLAVDRVGIRHIRHPIIFEDLIAGKVQSQPTTAYLSMYVNLPKHVKGTHMSRFIELINEKTTILSVARMPLWLMQMAERLNASASYFQAHFPYFTPKQAPVSKAQGLMDYDVWLWGSLEEETCKIYVTVVVPVTTLCPCSKEIANYGAHNQRSHVTVTVLAQSDFSLLKLIQLVESKASCELYSVLKRTDEKAVTERAYDNPKFVEDMVRDIGTSLETFEGIKGYKISSENFESIHNHSAFAEIDRLPVDQQIKPAAKVEKKPAILA